MTAGPALVKDLQAQLKKVTADLRARSEEPDPPWAKSLRAEHTAALTAGRTALSWSEWRDGEIDQAGVAWVLATVFVRFCEDNDLLDGAWIAGRGDRLTRAVDAETAFYQGAPERNARDWLREGFRALAATPAGRGILDPAHSPVWTAPLGAEACSVLLSFWRQQDADGSLLHDLTDPDWDTRFLGDVYQDLSVLAKKKYALLQTPVFVEEFILDRTLTPALAEFGLEGLRLIDATAGSGHFVLGAFQRLLAQWEAHAPGLDRRERVQRALDHVHGVDINPFAVAIARFRLTVAAMRADGTRRLADAPAYRYHLAVGDSLLAGTKGRQGDLLDLDAGGDGAAGFAYAAEDVTEHPGILDHGRYHVVVGNPPYITVKDKALNEAYRAAYASCKGKYALSVPFMELFFALAQKGDRTQPAGYVGQITSNSFMKREFGTKVIEHLLSGNDLDVPVDLTEVIDTSGAYIPGHGTPTVILIGRKQFPHRETVRAVLGVRGEPGQPEDPAKGLVWSQIVEHIDEPGYDGVYVTVTDLPREVLATHPWSLSGGGAGDVKEALDGAAAATLGGVADAIGIEAVLGEEDAYEVASWVLEPTRPLVIGEAIRDFSLQGSPRLWPYDQDLNVRKDLEGSRWLWPLRRVVRGYLMFGQTREERGLSWAEYGMFARAKAVVPLSLAFAEVATHNHVVLDRGGKVFKQTAPVIKLPAGASVEEHLDLLGVLNSSAACFWLKQVSHDKGIRGEGGGFTPSEWERFYQFSSTKWQDFPLPSRLPRDIATRLDALAQQAQDLLPAPVLARDGSLADAYADWLAVRAAMAFWQEELDWWVYRAYDLLDEDLTWPGEPVPLALGERAFEVALARRMAEGLEESAWFDRHGSTPITDLPATWPAGYRDLVQRRLDLIDADPRIGLLERPGYKRRWAGKSWDEMQREALVSFVLDRLEGPDLWRDAQGPRVLSVAGLADGVRKDERLVGVLRLLTGVHDVDVTKALEPLVRDEAVPFLAAYRYKPSGMTKRAEWERVWDLQRAEDANWNGGSPQPIPVPPKYAQADFQRPSYWKARGKLDVPKERFIAYPDAGREGDPTRVLGWAGWDHAQQAQALARLLVERSAEGWPTERLVPLLAGLAELESWLGQWHAEVDPAFGTSPAVAIRGLLDQQLSVHGLTRTDLAAWRPAVPTRGRRARG